LSAKFVLLTEALAVVLPTLNPIVLTLTLAPTLIIVDTLAVPVIVRPAFPVINPAAAIVFENVELPTNIVLFDTNAAPIIETVFENTEERRKADVFATVNELTTLSVNVTGPDTANALLKVTLPVTANLLLKVTFAVADTTLAKTTAGRTLPKKLLIVIFLVIGVPEGSSTIGRRSSGVACVKAKSSVIFFEAIY